MANFERYSSPSRGGSLSETRFESWVVAHSKNCGEQNLLKNRLKELDRERARSLYLLSMERRCVKKDHNKLLMDRKTLVNSPHFGESSNSRMNARTAVLAVRSDNDRIQERVNCWKIEMARRCQSASPRIMGTTTEDITDQAMPNQPMTSSGIQMPKRPSSSTISGNIYSNTADCPVQIDRDHGDAKPSDVDEARAISSTKDHGPNPASMSPRRRARRAEINRQVQSKVTRLRTLSRVPADFNLRAKTSSVSKSGQPQISLNFFNEHHLNGKSSGKSKGSPAQSRRKTHQNAR